MMLSSVLVIFSAVLAVASPVNVNDGSGIVKTVAERVPDATQENPHKLSEDTAIELPVEISHNNTERGLEARQYDSRTWTHTGWKLGEVDGSHDITMYSSGAVRFHTHFHDKGFFSYDYTLNCALKDAGSRAYTLSRKGHLPGTLESGSRTQDIDNTVTNRDVQANWKDIVSGDLIMHCKAHSQNSLSLSAILDILKDIVAAIGTVKTVIAIFAAA
jgi:hypothetical protein